MKSIAVSGRCRCGRVRFVLREEPIAFYLCHCTDCQAETGSAFGQTMHVRHDAVDALEGPARETGMEWRDGRRFTLTHCPNCLTIVFGAQDQVPQILGVNAGALEDVAGLTPYGNMWTRSARPWVAFSPGPRFEQQPEDSLAMVRAWAERPGGSS